MREIQHERERSTERGRVRHMREVTEICRDMLRDTDRQGDNDEEKERDRERGSD